MRSLVNTVHRCNSLETPSKPLQPHLHRQGKEWTIRETWPEACSLQEPVQGVHSKPSFALRERKCSQNHGDLDNNLGAPINTANLKLQCDRQQERMTMTMTHSDHQRKSETWPYGRDCWGHDSTQKESDTSVRLAQQARKTLGALYETVRRVTCDKFVRVQRSNHADTRCAHCEQMLSLRSHFPLLSIFLDDGPLWSTCRCSLFHCRSSLHLLFGLPTACMSGV